MTTWARDASCVVAVVVSFNTKILTIQAIESIFLQNPPPDIVVVDNGSSDGSIEAITERWPGIRLINSVKNIGFSKAVNLALKNTQHNWILLLNPDARLYPEALNNLIKAATFSPGHGVYGGRTVFADGSLNPDSCQGEMTPWSFLCLAAGLGRLFKQSLLFNPEGLGGWKRNFSREVDIIFGAFCLIDGAVWRTLGGFDERYWLYGEDTDLCLRAFQLTGKRPLFVASAVAVHEMGGAKQSAIQRACLIAKGRITVMKTHWPALWKLSIYPLALMWVTSRACTESAVTFMTRLRGRPVPAPYWRAVWHRRHEWMWGYDDR